MPRFNRYYPNYQKLYPGIEDRPDVLRVLKSSDRKMRYMERELKAGRFVADQKKQTVCFIPGRENSLEHMAEVGRQQFIDDCPGPEEQLLRSETLRQLQTALESLTDPERELIHALYFKQLSERQFSQTVGVSQQTVNNRKWKIIAKLRKFFE